MKWQNDMNKLHKLSNEITHRITRKCLKLNYLVQTAHVSSAPCV